MANWPVMYQFWSKYHLPIGNSNLPKNHSETSYLLNKLNVLFEMPAYDTIALFGRVVQRPTLDTVEAESADVPNTFKL